jgi:hypothetical protein
LEAGLVMDVSETYFEGLDGPQPARSHSYLGDLLDETRAFVRRFVVVGDVELVAIALWNAHTYVFDLAYATPYLNAHSPEPGSGKTTLLDVLSVLAKNPLQADNLTEAVLFRLIDAKTPTLLFDEVDAAFAKKNSDSTEGIRQVLNSGYIKNRHAFRCAPRSHELTEFNIFCPKATAGLHELPGTLAHRSIPIGMKPPLPSDVYEDFDPEQAVGDAEDLRRNLEAWAEEAQEVLKRTDLEPPKLPELDARGNQIWRLLFRIADQAGGDWPEAARTSARELSGADRRHQDASAGVKLLAYIRGVFAGDRMFCGALADALNELDDAPYGGWNTGAGITTRELGKKLVPYGVRAKAIRIGESRAKGYERAQFEDPWSRYLSTNPLPNSDTVTTRTVEPKTGETKKGQNAVVTLSETAANPHEQGAVPLVTVSVQGVEGLGDLHRPHRHEVQVLAEAQQLVDAGEAHWIGEESDFDPEALLDWLGRAPIDEVNAYFEEELPR